MDKLVPDTNRIWHRPDQENSLRNSWTLTNLWKSLCGNTGLLSRVEGGLLYCLSHTKYITLTDIRLSTTVLYNFRPLSLKSMKDFVINLCWKRNNKSSQWCFCFKIITNIYSLWCAIKLGIVYCITFYSYLRLFAIINLIRYCGIHRVNQHHIDYCLSV